MFGGGGARGSGAPAHNSVDSNGVVVVIHSGGGGIGGGALGWGGCRGGRGGGRDGGGGGGGSPPFLLVGSKFSWAKSRGSERRESGARAVPARARLFGYSIPSLPCVDADIVSVLEASVERVCICTESESAVRSVRGTTDESGSGTLKRNPKKKQGVDGGKCQCRQGVLTPYAPPGADSVL